MRRDETGTNNKQTVNGQGVKMNDHSKETLEILYNQYKGFYQSEKKQREKLEKELRSIQDSRIEFMALLSIVLGMLVLLSISASVLI